jgi:hypothetical protein
MGSFQGQLDQRSSDCTRRSAWRINIESTNQIHYPFRARIPSRRRRLDRRTKETLLQQAADTAQKVFFVCLNRLAGYTYILYAIGSEGLDRTHLAIPAQHAALVDVRCRCHAPRSIVGCVIELPWLFRPAGGHFSKHISWPAKSSAVDLVVGIATSRAAKWSES